MSKTNPPASKAVRAQARANRSTRDHWTHFACHRAEIQKLIVPDLHAPGTGRLCVLGAGNCNDIDLKALAEAFAEVHLVDIDAPALEAAVLRQEVAGSQRVHLHGGVDLTGVADVFAGWEKAPPSGADVAAASARVVSAPAPALPGPFDVVLSPCLLSQLVGYASDVLGERHPRRRELLAALRTRHLRMLVDLLKPGGAAVLVCDLANSEGEPRIGAERKPDLADLLDRLSHTGRHFDGLSPPAIESALKTDPLVAPFLGNVQQVRPWLWRLGPRRTFLVYAVRFRRLAGPVLLPPNRKNPPGL